MGMEAGDYVIGLGVCTYNRGDFCERTLKAVAKTCAQHVDRIVVINDGSDHRYHGSYVRAYRVADSLGAKVYDEPVNRGVAAAKNKLFDALSDCDWVIIAEDDCKPLSELAITGYVAAAEKSGLPHLSFAHHGPANAGGPVEVVDEIAYYPHSVGAWCLYSRDALRVVGPFDESMKNSMEHVEWEMRAYVAGFAPGGGPHRFADAAESAKWVAELPNSIEKSSIRPRDDWQDNIRNSMRYWKSMKRDTYELLFGPNMPLHAYANSILGES